MRRGHAPADERHARLDLRRALLDEREEVGVGDLLLRVRELDGLAVDAVERVAFELVAELAQLALQAAPTRQLADRQLAAGQADRLRRHDLVRERVLDDAVLVDARLVGEGVAADDGLVGLDREAGQVGDQPRRGRDVLGLDARAEVGELRRPGPEGHDDLLERRVAGALTQAVDRDLDLAGAGLDRGQRVGRGQPQVVVAVDADRGLTADEVHDPPGQRPELGRDRVADGVRDVDGRGAGFDDGLVDLQQVVDVGARRVLGAELDLGVAAELLAAVADPADRLGEGRVAIDPQLVLEVDVARGDEHVEMRPVRDLDRLDRPLRVAVAAAGQGRDRDVLRRLLGDPPDGLEVAG